MHKIQLVISSVRASRIGDQIAGWIVDQAAGVPTLDIDLVDLRDWHLPMDDEPLQPKQYPAMDSYQNDHSRAWSRKVQEAAGFVFLLPQYNWGYPASLKNALDHLYHEWADKPAVIVTYGSRGGGKAADQLVQVMQGIHLNPVATRPALPLKEAAYTEAGRLADPATAFSEQKDEVVTALQELSQALD
ncbi:NADPH-dependent FMN reductase [Puniceibacterium sp. IMCC21224]|uniref:NADPH-dependent FMN reductase n=1 Tax=Puniceibacterium sp. IMCC21224 TaxID=1618204 RepID=UPI00064D94DD|nr:NAD(P)H-dependent oxidoreductase [Puniceibacterium sp. IMCC21224]KMK65168.1 putative flavoprotein [Puniceibacterium sp. IMCC21224]